MNELLQEKLDQLTIELQKRRQHYRNSLRNAVYFCVIILVFFSLYAALVSYKIREIATPSTIALLIAGQLREQFADELKNDQTNIRRTARDMTQSALVAMPVSIHAGEELLKDSMTGSARSAALDLSLALKEPLKRNIDLILADRSPSGQRVAQLNERLVRQTDLAGKVDSLRTLLFPLPFAFGPRLHDIRLKKGAALTRQDLCDRDFALCWLYLNENERYRDGSRYAESLMSVTSMIIRSWEDVMKPLEASAQNRIKNRPVQNNTPAMP